jgi:hypothetical protein
MAQPGHRFPVSLNPDTGTSANSLIRREPISRRGSEPLCSFVLGT